VPDGGGVALDELGVAATGVGAPLALVQGPTTTVLGGALILAGLGLRAYAADGPR